tara:strand:- start:8479 stop:9339 length:861 start_codon:yes stop_codon:yes gene_type:complete
MKKLAVIIPTFNRKNHLANLLNTLGVERLNNNIVLIVVNDGSSDGTNELLLSSYPEVVIVQGTGDWWWTRSINEGLRKAISLDCNTFLLMNDDTFVKSSFLENAINQFENLKSSVLGFISITAQKPERIFFSGIKKSNLIFAKFYRYHSYLASLDKNINGQHISDFLPGRGMMFSDSLLKEIGYFDQEKLPQYFADFDFSQRALRAGYNVVISWDLHIYAHIALTAKGNRSNTNFINLLKSFSKANTPNNYKSTWYFYKNHLKAAAHIAFVFHYTRVILSYFKNKF